MPVMDKNVGHRIASTCQCQEYDISLFTPVLENLERPDGTLKTSSKFNVTML